MELCSLLFILSVADVVSRGRLRWFGHLCHKNEDAIFRQEDLLWVKYGTPVWKKFSK